MHEEGLERLLDVAIREIVDGGPDLRQRLLRRSRGSLTLGENVEEGKRECLRRNIRGMATRSSQGLDQRMAVEGIGEGRDLHPDMLRSAVPG